MIEPAYRYRALCHRVIDGDTYVLDVDLGFRSALQIEGRLRGVDTPELNTASGQRAKLYVAELIMGLPLVIESYHDRRSFARWVVDVYLGGASLAERIIADGYGVLA